MKEAIKIAKNNENYIDVPVGCVIVKDNKIIASACNTREKNNDPLGHAEINAIKIAAQKLQSRRLNSCDIYVTLEPCVMCAGAILYSQFNNLFFGAYDFRLGACGTNENIFYSNKEICKTRVYGGILEEECKKILSDFFENIRQNRKEHN